MRHRSPSRGADSDIDLAGRVEAALTAEPDVVVAYLFGSVARGSLGPRSDVDIAVLLADGSDSFERRLDLSADLAAVTAPRPVDVVVLNEAPVALAYRVLRDGRLLLSRDDRVRIRHWTQTVDRYLDMADMRRVLEEGQRVRLREGSYGRR
jgi:uncharacterized protein